MTRLVGTKVELKVRRRLSVELLKQGFSIPEVAERLDVTPQGVWNW